MISNSITNSGIVAIRRIVETTFFVVGSRVDKYPETIKALHDAGHIKNSERTGV